MIKSEFSQYLSVNCPIKCWRVASKSIDKLSQKFYQSVLNRFFCSADKMSIFSRKF